MTVTQLPARFTIGGSDAAAAAGIDPYRSRIMLWLEKTGRIERPETEAMRWGTLLEPVIFEELGERGYDVTPARDLAAMPNRMVSDGRVQHPDVPWLVGHPDGLVTDDDGLGVLEVKTASQWAHRNGDGPPLPYVAQVQHYLHLTALDRGLLAVLVAGQRLELYDVTRNQHAIDLLLEREEDFYGFLVRDEPPPPDSSESAREAVAAMFPEATPSGLHRLTAHEWSLLGELRARREQADAIGRQKTELENRLKLAMGDAELAISPHDVEAIRWANVESRRLDTSRLREERPEVYDEYATTTSTRRFTVL